MYQSHGLKRGIGFELGRDRCRIDWFTPLAFELYDLQPEPSCHFVPERCKVPVLAEEHPVAGRQGVGQCGFPGAGG